MSAADSEEPANAATDAAPDAADASREVGSATPERGSRWPSVIGWSALGIVVLGIAWVVVTGLVARSRLEDARSQLGALRKAVVAGDTARAQRLADQIADNADTAHALTTGPAWWVTSNLPVIGSPLRTGRILAAQADRLGDDVLPGVIQILRTVPSSGTTTLSSLDLSPIARAVPDLNRAARTARSASQTVDATSGSWLPLVSSARDSFASSLTRLDGELAGADRAVRVLLPLLGEKSRQRYFIGFLNEAESRGGGGIPGAFAIATAENGRVRFERFGSDDDLKGATARVRLGADFDARYQGNDPLGTIQNSNLSPDFSYAGRIWAGMWQAKTGERIDGALAIDPTALGYLLRATGPAKLADGSTVSSRNVVALTQREQYRLFPGTSRTVSDQRKRYLIGLARGISDHLTKGGNPAQLVKAISRAATERRFVVWSRYPGIETELQTADWAGGLGNDRGEPFAGFAVNNAAGSKLDYYLERQMTYRRTACGAGGRATAVLELTNDAPRSGLPAYVTLRADGAPSSARPGDNRLLVTYYASGEARVQSMTVDGRAVPLVSLREGDTRAVTTTVELPVDATVRLVVTVAEPAASGPVQVLRQPGVRKLRVDTSGDSCR